VRFATSNLRGRKLFSAPSSPTPIEQMLATARIGLCQNHTDTPDDFFLPSRQRSMNVGWNGDRGLTIHIVDEHMPFIARGTVAKILPRHGTTRELSAAPRLVAGSDSAGGARWSSSLRVDRRFFDRRCVRDDHSSRSS